MAELPIEKADEPLLARCLAIAIAVEDVFRTGAVDREGAQRLLMRLCRSEPGRDDVNRSDHHQRKNAPSGVHEMPEQTKMPKKDTVDFAIIERSRLIVLISDRRAVSAH